MSTKTKLCVFVQWSQPKQQRQQQLWWWNPTKWHFTVTWRWHCLLCMGATGEQFGALFWYYSLENGTMNPFLFVHRCKRHRCMASMLIPVLLNAQKPSGTKIGCVAHFMTVNSIFNNSKMILWFGIVRYDTRSDPMPDESVNFWIFYHLNIKTVAEFGWWVLLQNSLFCF